MGRTDDGYVTSFLIQPTSACRYIFVGESVFEFDTNAPVVSFNSPLCGSDVAYPFAFDASGYVYLMIENVVFHSSSMDNVEREPYKYYYRAYHITQDMYDKRDHIYPLLYPFRIQAVPLISL